MLEKKIDHISFEDYLVMEETAKHKNEYYHDEIFAMTGASVNHNLIVSNTITALNVALNHKNCFVFPTDIKVQIDPGFHYTYPDVSVVSGDIQFVDGRDDTITNPLVIAEVLSRSTMDYDRGSKFRAYRNISSLCSYILFDQYSISVEFFQMNENGNWVLTDLVQKDDKLKIDSLDVTIPLSRIYDKITLQEEV